MYRGWRVWVLSAVLAVVPTSLVRADVSVYGRTENSLFVDILGTITSQDPAAFADAIQDLETAGYMPGSTVRVAMYSRRCIWAAH